MMVGESDDDGLDALEEVLCEVPSISNDDWGDRCVSFSGQGLTMYYSKSQKRYPIALFRVCKIDLPGWKDGPYDGDFPAGILASDSRDMVQAKIGQPKSSYVDKGRVGTSCVERNIDVDAYEYKSLELKFAFDCNSGEMLHMSLQFRQTN